MNEAEAQFRETERYLDELLRAQHEMITARGIAIVDLPARESVRQHSAA